MQMTNRTATNTRNMTALHEIEPTKEKRHYYFIHAAKETELDSLNTMIISRFCPLSWIARSPRAIMMNEILFEEILSSIWWRENVTFVFICFWKGAAVHTTSFPECCSCCLGYAARKVFEWHLVSWRIEGGSRFCKGPEALSECSLGKTFHFTHWFWTWA